MSSSSLEELTLTRVLLQTPRDGQNAPLFCLVAVFPVPADGVEIKGTRSYTLPLEKRKYLLLCLGECVMVGCRHWLLVLSLSLCVPLAATTASAMEFSVSGAYVMEYDHVGQAGTAGFFGPHNVDASGLDRHQMNFYAGHEVGLDSTVSGLDAAVVTHWMYMNPVIQINKAVKLTGQYYIGSWNFLPDYLRPTTETIPQSLVVVPTDPVLVASEYQNSVNRGVQNSFSPGYWNWLKLSVKLPWGSLSIGKRPSNFGMGLMNNGDENTSSNSISLSVPYGPLLIGLSFYPARWGNEGYYNSYSDRSNIRPVNFAYGATYTSGPFQMGFAIGHVTRHQGGERYIGSLYPNREREDLDLGVFMKYNNGRFFLNAEAREYDRRDRLTLPSAADNHTEDNEVHAWAAELGWYAGPAKVSLIVANVSGIDRRGEPATSGSYFLKDNTIANISPNFSNSGLFLPYSYLMVYSYSLGLAANPQTGNGFVDAAHVYGARLDYAAAANLNTYGTFFYALRPTKGFGWGHLRPPRTDNRGGPIRRNWWSDANQYRSPAIPDDFLGWEFDLGVDWKLLEGLTFSGRFAYWEVGDWFKYACVSMDNPGWNNGQRTNQWGINPDRIIDPVYAWNVTLTAEF